MKKRISILLMAIIMCFSETTFAAVNEDEFSEIENKLPQLYSLIELCENKGIDTAYERINYETLVDFVTFGKDDIDMGDTDRAEYVLNTLYELYEDTTNALNDYLNDVQLPKDVYRYSTADEARISGSNIEDKNGNPLFLNGYGHFNSVRNEIDRMQDFGANFVAIEIGPNDVIGLRNRIDGWSVNKNNGVDASVEVVEGGYSGGSYGLKLVNNTSKATNTYVNISRDVIVKPNTTYHFKFKARGTGVNSAYFTLSGWDSERNLLDTGSGAWKEYSASYKTTATQTSMTLMVVCDDKTTSLLLDDFVLLEETSTENILYNGDFEISNKMQSEHFSAVGYLLWDKVSRSLIDAERNNVRVDLLISPHYMSEYLKESYPEMYAIDSGMGFDMRNGLVREYFDLYIKKIVEMVGESPALNSICLVNEPRYNTRNTGLDTLFQAYLIKLYNNNLELLNQIYDSNYLSFDDISIPENDSYDAIYRDWVFFNDEYYAEFYKYLADCVKKYSNIPVHGKIMSIFGNTDYCNYGVDPELFAEFCDYNGNDCWGFYSSTDAYAMNSKHMWYDLLKSINDVPILNAEDHIIEDRNTNYNKNQATHIAADMWQGAIHGRDATALWLWERTDNKGADAYGNIRFRPDAIVEVGKTNLNINRNAAQIVALQDAKATVSILYSKNSSTYSGETYTSGMMNSYRAALMTGSNPDFITERQLESQKSPTGDVLLVPNATNISVEALEQIIEYQKQGGKVISIGSNCLLRDEHNLPHNITFEFDYSSPSNNIREIRNYITSNINNIFVPKDEDGEFLENIDVRATIFNNCKLVNLCNLSWLDGTKYVNVGGEVIDSISGKKYNNIVPLEPLKPMLLQFEEEKNVTVEFEKNNGVVDVEISNNTTQDIIIQLNTIMKDTSGEIRSSSYVKKFIDAEETTSYRYCISDCGDFDVSVTGSCVDLNGREIEVSINN